ncbi:MAG: malate synthase A [Sediminibacterium sp.]|nr:malate synthase A [Sediminibacterium sp.]
MSTKTTSPSSITSVGYSCPSGMEVHGNFNPVFSQILSLDALIFLKELHIRFNARRLALLSARELLQADIDAGKQPDFLPQTAIIRNSEWKVAPLPNDLIDRRVEITGPVDRKMVINALNSGAKVFMADFEDSNSPNWMNTIQGQINLRDAIRGTIEFSGENGKTYQLNKSTATLMVRPRGWHLPEKHISVHGETMSGSLVDFGLYFFHNAKALINKGSGPYFYLPKIENYREARLWDDVFIFAQNYLHIPHGTIKATVLVETILASFQLHEILWELRDHSAGLNCGRWDYIFSFIKKFKNRPGYIFPDRSEVTMTAPFMRAYTQLVVQTCHKRGVHAMGGMAAQIPIKNDAAANEAAIAKVKADKLREVTDGHDGTWVAHPGLVSVALDVFNEHMPLANQIDAKPRTEFQTSKDELIALPQGKITEEGIRSNINVGILYIESWLRGNGAAAIYNLMEDAATAEISRTQLWQWIHANATTTDGKKITPEWYLALKAEELEKIKSYVGEAAFDAPTFRKAAEIFDDLVLQDELTEFLTLPAYSLIP